eukprot:COSAG02_NODE_291_length_25510_cov_9.433828_7_plen_280_part_00
MRCKHRRRSRIRFAVLLVACHSVIYATAGPCAEEDLPGRARQVTGACCDDPTEDCSSGQPASCNAGCAAVLVPYLQDCQLVMDKDALRSVQEAAERCPVSPCLIADLENRVALVHAECCDDPGEDCSSGEPATCDAGCAAVLVPYFQDCRSTLELMASEGEQTVKAIKAAVDRCPANNCAPLPTIMDGQWDVQPDGLRAILLCDQGACEVDDCVPSVQPSGHEVSCVNGQWPNADSAQCTPTGKVGGVVERTCNPAGMQELCTVQRIGALAENVDCHDP